MAKAGREDQIDHLYQLPLAEFTAARNALAKETGEGELKKLEKPNLAAWTVNQLFWQERRLYDRVIAAAEAMRAAYKQMLAGKRADVREAEEAHGEALRDAKQAARRILEAGGHANPDAVMMAVGETLDALPGEEPPGRLTRPLRRMGFNVLEGVPISAKAVPLKPRSSPKAAPDLSAKERRALETEEREAAMTRERLRFAEAAEREAEATHERAARTAERAERTRERIEQELAEAEAAARQARREQAAAEIALAKAKVERERLSRKLSG
jgi:hypothetical protein